MKVSTMARKWVGLEWPTIERKGITLISLFFMSLNSSTDFIRPFDCEKRYGLDFVLEFVFDSDKILYDGRI